jgi:hypothetical protein
MPKKKKRLTDLTTEEVIKKLFPKRVIEKVKKIAHEKDTPKSRKRA